MPVPTQEELLANNPYDAPQEELPVDTSGKNIFKRTWYQYNLYDSSKDPNPYVRNQNIKLKMVITNIIQRAHISPEPPPQLPPDLSSTPTNLDAGWYVDLMRHDLRDPKEFHIEDPIATKSWAILYNDGAVTIFANSIGTANNTASGSKNRYYTISILRRKRFRQEVFCNTRVTVNNGNQVVNALLGQVMHNIIMGPTLAAIPVGSNISMEFGEDPAFFNYPAISDISQAASSPYMDTLQCTVHRLESNRFKFVFEDGVKVELYGIHFTPGNDIYYECGGGGRIEYPAGWKIEYPDSVRFRGLHETDRFYALETRSKLDQIARPYYNTPYYIISENKKYYWVKDTPESSARWISFDVRPFARGYSADLFIEYTNKRDSTKFRHHTQLYYPRWSTIEEATNCLKNMMFKYVLSADSGKVLGFTVNSSAKFATGDPVLSLVDLKNYPPGMLLDGCNAVIYVDSTLIPRGENESSLLFYLEHFDRGGTPLEIHLGEGRRSITGENDCYVRTNGNSVEGVSACGKSPLVRLFEIRDQLLLDPDLPAYSDDILIDHEDSSKRPPVSDGHNPQNG